MNPYLLKYDTDEEDFVKPVLLVSDKNYTDEQFQKCIQSAKFELGHFCTFDELVERLEKYGFKKIVTGYFYF